MTNRLDVGRNCRVHLCPQIQWSPLQARNHLTVPISISNLTINGTGTHSYENGDLNPRLHDANESFNPLGDLNCILFITFQETKFCCYVRGWNGCSEQCFFLAYFISNHEPTITPQPPFLIKD